MRMLGNMMQSQQEQSAPAEIRKISDKTTFDKLPKEFTYDDLRNAKGACKEATYRSTIKRWRKNNMIEDADQGTIKLFRKKIA